MSTSSLQLLTPTNRTVTGPKFRFDGSQIVVEYDYERDDGTIEWSEIVIDEVLAFEYREGACCRGEDVVGPHEVRCQDQSERLSAVLDHWQKSVGWEEWQQEQGGAARFRQFTVFFDNAGCIDVVAVSCRVLPAP